MTIPVGGKVKLSYSDGDGYQGSSFHNVDFTGPQPTSCSGVPAQPRPPGWSGECEFDAPGTYTFRCDLHQALKKSQVHCIGLLGNNFGGVGEFLERNEIAAARTSRVSRSALAPAKLIAMASSTPGKTCIGAHTRAEATLAA